MHPLHTCMTVLTAVWIMQMGNELEALMLHL